MTTNYYMCRCPCICCVQQHVRWWNQPCFATRWKCHSKMSLPNTCPLLSSMTNSLRIILHQEALILMKWGHSLGHILVSVTLFFLKPYLLFQCNSPSRSCNGSKFSRHLKTKWTPPSNAGSDLTVLFEKWNTKC